MNVVGARELDATPDRIRETATFNEGGRNAEPDEREPTERQQVDPGKDPEPRQAERQERDEAHGQRDEHGSAAADRAHERDGAGVGACEQQWSRDEDHGESRGALELRVRYADDGRTDAERERGPEARGVELQRFRDELPDGTGLRRERRRQLGAVHAIESSCAAETPACRRPSRARKQRASCAEHRGWRPPRG